MKKFDTLIATYLYQNKKMELEGIGHFTLDDNFIVPPDADKTAFYPLEGINFKHNSRAETSPGLIDFIVQQTGKIKSLIRADFSSYVSEISQFVNLGKPWAIEGIGTLHKTREGVFELTPGAIVSERINMHYVDEPETDKEPVKNRKWVVGLLFTLAIMAVIAGLAFGVYVLFIKTQDAIPEQEQAFTLPEDTSTVKPIDTLPLRDSIVRPVPLPEGRYKVVFETTPKRQRALSRTAQLNEFGVNALIDSITVNNIQQYRLYIFKDIRIEDTTRIKDSLSMYFGRRVTLQTGP